MIKKIFLLIGAKGSGKSYIGSLIQEIFGIPFLRVEDWVKPIKNERDITNELYRVEAFATIESGVREFLTENDNVVFESIGLTHQFERMLESLQNDFEVITIGIKANPELCLQRIKLRNQVIHVTVSEDKIRMVNSEFEKRNLPASYTIENNKKSSEELAVELKKIIDKS